MSAYQVVSLDARQVKLTETCHTPEAADREAANRKANMHTAIKIFEVAVEPLAPDAMTKSSRSAKPGAVRA